LSAHRPLLVWRGSVLRVARGAVYDVARHAETFAAGDRLAIINEDPADATLADLSITFLGKRT